MSTQNLSKQNSENLESGTTAAGETSSGGRRPEDEVSPAAAPPAPTEAGGNQVKAGQKSPKRKFPVSYKIKILAAYDGCENSLARGELLRKEGLYYNRISAWRNQRDAG